MTILNLDHKEEQNRLNKLITTDKTYLPACLTPYSETK